MTTSSMEAVAVSSSDAVVIDHEFKSHASVFWPAAHGQKMFEYRRDDRGGYEVGQTVRLRLWHGDTGYADVPPLDRRISNILRGGEFELPPGFCVLGLVPLNPVPAAKAPTAPALVPEVPESVRRLSEAQIAKLAAALDGLSDAAEQWKAHGGDQAHRILPLIHPSFNAVYEAYKPIRGTLLSPSGRADEGNQDAAERQHRAEVELQEIADGAYGDNPMVRGAARDRLDSLNTRASPAPSGRADTPPGGGGVVPEGWRKVLRDLLNEHDKHVCLHEETHRGGAIWTICDHCGRKWADDEGGFQPYEEPPAVTAAWSLLKCEEVAATPAAPEPPTGGGREIVRHVNRRDGNPRLGGAYEVLHEGVALQVATDRLSPGGHFWAKHLIEGERLVVYRGADGKVWAREEGEFRDGRFETVTDPQSILSAPTGAEAAGGDGKGGDDDREIDRILAMNGDELRAELVAEGHDPDALVRQMKQGLDGTLRLAADRQRWREEAASAEQRIDNLVAALASAQRQRIEQQQRATAAEQRIIELEQSKVHPALSIDVQEHRNQAYQNGWSDGYAEGHAKALVDPTPADAGASKQEG